MLRFAVASTPDIGQLAFDELNTFATRDGAQRLEPVFVPNYVALFETVHLHAADAAWCPPLVARDLARVGAADPIATVLRGGMDHYYSALVTLRESHVRRLKDIQSARIGWVSRLSAAGYVVPRDYLQSLGFAVDAFDESFFHTHGECVSALLAGEIDVIGTYASSRNGSFHLSPLLDEARILGVAGQIPGDVIVVTRAVSKPVARALASALHSAFVPPRGPLASLMNASGFGFVPPRHLDSLARWMERSTSTSFRFVVRPGIPAGR
ncbi:MAG TPA: PhnD/SsuA/transferrin family substrate-binding protein [Polyangiaceae bacterium]|jgi:ABC-type phosphate/phosphonate transport system substrate-binding protein